MQVNILGSIRSALLSRAARANQFTLPGGKQDCIAVQPAGQIVEVVSGAAWVACAAQDWELTVGQRCTLPTGGDAALISALGPNTLVFRLHAADSGHNGDGSSTPGKNSR